MKFKTLLFSLFIGLILSSCSKNDDNQNNNPYIPNAVFDTGSLINTTLPQYNQMQFPGNYITLNSNYGIKGVVLYYAGNNNYSAFELSDPNHAISSCSKLTVNGIVATCGCADENAYEILNGTKQDGGQYPMTRYNVEVSGSVIRVFNN